MLLTNYIAMKNKLFYCFIAILLTVFVASYVVYNRYEYRNDRSYLMKIDKITGSSYVYDKHKAEWVPYQLDK
ncbi:hypothetical protein MASR1M31_16490 [Porphyromonadaceae bacterium]